MSNLDEIRRLIAAEQERLSQLDDLDYLFDDIESDFLKMLEGKGETQRGFQLSDSFKAKFPLMSQLLFKARVTPIKAGGNDYLVIGWLESDSRTVWLCHAPQSNVSHLHPDHQLLAAVMGGISQFVESVNSRLANLYWALLLSQEKIVPNFDVPISRFAANADMPKFDFDQYYVVAYEANGSQTICHRESGELLMICHDPSGQITPLPNWPRNTFFTLDECATFQEWVEGLAAEYLEEMEL
ncbi:MAG: hypothetical protein AAF902_11560 [Chloroflexota bacterium]